jgi:pilus assembly protein CpaF
MADPSLSAGSRIIPPIVRTPRPVAQKIQQEIKSAVHQGLIKRLDLDKVALMHQNRGSQKQLLEVIHQLIDEQSIPLS